MVLHGMSHEVRHLVVAPVVLLLHRVQDAALHGLETVVEMRHRTLEDNVRRIVEKPVLVHSRELVLHRVVLAIILLRLVVGMFVARVVVFVNVHVVLVFVNVCVALILVNSAHNVCIWERNYIKMNKTQNLKARKW